MSGDELVDVVDDQDRVTHQVTRSEIRRGNLRHRSVYILVFNSDGRLFIHQRTANKDVFPGYWDVTIGGVVQAGEEYNAAARRELQEELGIHPSALRRLFSMRYDDPANRVAGVVYSCTWDGVVQLQESEIVCGEWIDLDVLLERTQRDRFCPDGLEALRLYLAKLDAARARR